MTGTRTEAKTYLDHCWEQGVKPDVRRLADILGSNEAEGQVTSVQRALRSGASDSAILAEIEEITASGTS